ncbi:MAG: lipase family alpha/beta hydrolase [bacterium]
MPAGEIKFDLFSGISKDLRRPDKTKAVLLHGLDHKGKDMGILARDLAPLYDCVVIGDYDWRHAFDRLSGSLAKFLEHSTGGRSVDLIGHSYGGLVARHYVETVRPGRAARVRNAVLLNTPNHGCALFNFMRASPLIEYPSRFLSRGLKSFRLLVLDDRDRSIKSLTELGRAENQLDELNRRPRNPVVTYWVIATERDWWRVGGKNWELPAGDSAKVFHLLLTPPHSNAFTKVGRSMIAPEAFGHSDVLHRPWATGFTPIVKRITSRNAPALFASVNGSRVVHINDACRVLRKAEDAVVSRLTPGLTVHKVCATCTALEARPA